MTNGLFDKGIQVLALFDRFIMHKQQFWDHTQLELLPEQPAKMAGCACFIPLMSLVDWGYT